MPIENIVSVTISAVSPNVTQAGFGTMLILGTPSWTERTRSYTDLTAVAADFAATRPEYLAAQAAFAQNPRPPRVMVGRLANKPTQTWTFTPTAHDNTAYKVRIGTQTATFTSAGSATVAQICTGLAGAITALAVSGLTATDNTTNVSLAAGTAGAWYDVEDLTPSVLKIAQDHADPGVGTDLDAILLEDASWYCVINPWNSQLMATGVATWVESNTRIFVCDSQDSEIVNHVLSGATDLAASLKSSTRRRTAVMYHPSTGSFIAAAWAGRCLPFDPGSETWALKQLSGPAFVQLTPTQRTNALAKNANVYELIAGLNVTEMGTVADGEYVDVVRFYDWVSARIKERVFADLAANPKIPYTDEGIAQLAGDVASVLSDGVAAGGFVAGSTQVQVPKAKDANPADKAARILKNLNFSAVLAGAVHTVQVNGTVSV